MAQFSFPRQARILKSSEFRDVYRRGIRLRRAPLRVVAMHKESGGCRLGLAIGRKAGKAVVRNRWKRAIREAFRLQRHRLTADWDLVVSTDWDAAPADAKKVAGAFDSVVKALNARVSDGAGGVQ